MLGASLILQGIRVYTSKILINSECFLESVTFAERFSLYGSLVLIRLGFLSLNGEKTIGI